MLLHDAQYGDSEYPFHVGWGHSAVAHVVDFARTAEVGELVLFHHDPYHSDDQLEDLVAEARTCWGNGHERVQAAWEGMNITLDTDRVLIERVGDDPPERVR